jgi:hypothetical protein
MWLAKKLGREDVPRPLWELLESEGYVEELLDGNRPLTREDFFDLAQERLQFAKEMAPSFGANARLIAAPRTPQHGAVEGEHWRVYRESEIDALANESVIPRAEAFSLYVANLANKDPKVENFREELLDAGHTDLLSEREARAFLFSPATALFPFNWFKDNNVPFTGHKARVLELEELPPKVRRQLRGTAKVEWDGGEIVSPFEGRALSSDPFYRKEVGSTWVPALKGSVISDLALLDEHLTGRFPWPPLKDYDDILQVPKFVLTGLVPWVAPLGHTVPTGNPDLYQAVDITVWPWVPVEAVTRLYELVRKELNPTPTTSPKRLSLFNFVMLHPEVEVLREGEKPKVPSWRELLRSWNERYPEGDRWHYKDVRNFQRDFKEAFDQIANFYRSNTGFPNRSEVKTFGTQLPFAPIDRTGMQYPQC